VSKKAAKRTKAVTAPPLVSRHWWTLNKALSYCRERKGVRDIGDFALCEAFNQKGLPVKIEWVDQQTNPSSLAGRLLSPEDYVAKPAQPWENSLQFLPRRDDVPYLDYVGTGIPDHRVAVFFWGPKMTRLLPAEEVESELKAESEAQHRQKPGTKAIGNWPDLLTCEVVRVAVEEPKLIRDRSKLVTHLRRVLTAEIKGWNLTQDKAIHRELDHLFNRIASLRSNST